MNRFLSSLLSCITIVGACDLSGTAARADQIDEFVASEMKLRNYPGVALAVVRGAEVVKLGGYGLANIENEIPVTPKTVFQIQSVTKQFVATAIMMLVEEGKLSLDAKLPDLFEETPEVWKPITVRHLLNHTSGIKDFINEPTASLRLEVTDEEVYTETAKRPLNFKPGEKYAYSNSNYHLLAMLIKKISGKHYGEFLKERIFDPLEMHDTRLMSWTEIVPRRASGYLFHEQKFRNGHFVAESILAYGGGGIISTAEDMAKWGLALRTEKLLQRSSFEQMWLPTTLLGGGLSQYGFGWGVAGEKPHRSVSHSGGHMTGFTSVITRFLDDDLCIVVLVNARHANPARMARALAGFYVPDLAPAERKPIEDTDPIAAERLKTVVRMFKESRLEDEVFTPELRRMLAAQLPILSQNANTLGALKRLELLERNDSNDGSRRLVYRLVFDLRSPEVSMTINKENKIAGFNVLGE